MHTDLGKIASTRRRAAVRKPTRSLLLGTIAAAVVATLGIGTASATVLTWNYDFSSQFETGKTKFQSAGRSGCTTNTTTTLAWGEGTNNSDCTSSGNANTKRSSLVLDPSSGASIPVVTWIGSGTPPPPYSDPGIILTHNNQSIDITAKTLLEASLKNTITLTPTNPSGGSLTPFSFSFDIDFRETANQAGQCAVNQGPACPDIFVIGSNALNQTFSYDAGDGDGLLTYYLSVFPLSPTGALDWLPAKACTEAGFSGNCFGFITEENKSNKMSFGLAISTEPFHVSVPEPGALGMMGLGVLGIGLAFGLNRRRNRREA